MAFAIIFSVPFGVISALKPDSSDDHSLMTISMFGILLLEFFLVAPLADCLFSDTPMAPCYQLCSVVKGGMGGFKVYDP